MPSAPLEPVSWRGAYPDPDPAILCEAPSGLQDQATGYKSKGLQD